MKSLKYIALVVGVLFLSCVSTRTTAGLSKTLSEFQNADAKTVLVAAHRGAHNGNFENSIASTRQAIRLGVDIIEVDVRTTKDGHLVLMHDSKIDRTTTGQGKVEDLTLAEIKEHKLKAPDGSVSAETVPTFSAFLKEVKGKIMVDVDMKTDNVTGILADVKRTGTDAQVFYFDNDYEQLDRIVSINKTAKLMPRAYSYQMADSAITRYSPPVVHIDPSFYDSEVTAMLRKHKARVWINTLGEADSLLTTASKESTMADLLRHGANIIQTDQPEILLQYLRSKGLHP
ncbi:MAG: glycerophosphodiester phosphodiesterase family protein [Flavobacteriaceae bacterium]